MGYKVFSLKGGKSSDTREFYEAMDMAKEGLERVCELAEEMADQYGERRGRGMRSVYGNRYGERDDWDEMDYGERRRRDSRGRYM